MPRRRVIVSVLSIVLAGLLYYFYAGSTAPVGQPPLMRLDAANFGELREAMSSRLELRLAL